MGLDFDVKTFCQNLKATKPPYECPVEECGKVYKSFCGIQFHLYNYNHDNPQANSPSGNGKSKKKGRGSWHHRVTRRSPSPAEFLKSPSREGLSYAEAQRLVEVEVDGRIHRIDIGEPLDIIMTDGIDENNSPSMEKVKIDEKKSDNARFTPVKHRKDTTTQVPATPQKSEVVKLPEANFRVIDDLERPDVPPRPIAYYRFIEKSTEELDEEVEYDMDEEDCAWLELINEKRQIDDLPVVSADIFELLMDRLEKESYFQSQSTGKDPNPSIDEDAVCCICNDGECQNSNVILFCDMCNLAVHQECYGVPYIPEGQWLCRRCLQSPSRAVDCALCPNKGGAFKQTDDGGWAHVVCALWVPEVQFANTVFLEPIDSINNIPTARWKLTCYICKQRGVGACIQCHKANCYTAFHVTCAQQAGLHMKMEPIRDVTISPGGTGGGTVFSVRKTAYCDVHTPADNESVGTDDGDGRMDSVKKAKAKAKSRLKMRKARKILAEKRSAVPVVSIPTIPHERLNNIAQMVTLVKKSQYIQRLAAYWTLKRQSRNGVPLLRRLQSTQQSRRSDFENESDKALREQLKYWQRLRQDLERARLLVELIRKREKLKRELVKVRQLEVEMRIQPFVILLREALDLLQDKDPGRVFAEAVDPDEVPDYVAYIRNPMDFAMMREKIEYHRYSNMDDFEKDFNLIISNCMAYNSKDTMFYRAALKMRDQGGAIMRQVRRQADVVGYDRRTGVHLCEPPKIDENQDDETIIEAIDNFLNSIDYESKSLDDMLKNALDLLDLASYIKHGGARTKRAKTLKSEITVIRRKLALQASGKVAGKKSSTKKSGGVKSTDSRTRITPSTKINNQESADESSSSDSESDSGSDQKDSSSDEEQKPALHVKTRPKPLHINAPVVKSTRMHANSIKSPTPQILSPKFRPSFNTSTNIAVPSSPDHSTALRSRTSSTSKSPPSSPHSMMPELTGLSAGMRGRRASTVAATKAQRASNISNRPPKPVAKTLKRSRSDSDRSPPPSKRVELGPSESHYPNTPIKSSSSASPSTNVMSHASSLTSSRSGVVVVGGGPSPAGSNNGNSSTGSPSGVNRRTAVLFKKKMVTPTANASDDTSSESGFKRPANPLSSAKSHRIRSRRSSNEGLASGPYIPGMERPSSKKRSSNSGGVSMSASARKHAGAPSIGGPVMFDDDYSVPTHGDSFKVYRSGKDVPDTDSDNNSETSSTSGASCTSDSERSELSQSGESDSELDENSERKSRLKTRSRSWNANDSDFIPLEPLDLVWAKCRGYPWYPALIINPKMPKTGYFHNGVPIPVPPDEVLSLQKTFNDYLVLFFDAKRTWQWLQRHKLEPLGVDTELDKAKLTESRKPAERKAVKKAFEKAILHRCRVTGESTRISEESSSNDD